jgi:hypothetical protein
MQTAGIPLLTKPYSISTIHFMQAMDALVGLLADRVEERCRVHGGEPPCIVTSLFYARLVNPVTGQYVYSNVERWTQRQSLRIQASRVYIIVNADAFHWVVAEVTGTRTTLPHLRVYDSLKAVSNSYTRSITQVRVLINKEGQKGTCCQQKNRGCCFGARGLNYFCLHS